MLDLFNDSKRAVANLMARENITVQVIDGLDTAKFSPELRILQVPNWTGLTVEQCDLLMSHEIGHGLFTSRTAGKGLKPGLFSYLNIIEDARIERRMKGAFPGLAPTFFKGYREFHTNGPILKGTNTALINPKTGEQVAIASMKLIDRINLHYKIGAFATVPFTAEERVWLSRIDKATSTEDCLTIARELHKLAKERDTKEQQQNPSNQPNPSKGPKQEETEESDSDNSQDQDASDGESQDGDEDESDDQNGAGDTSDEEDEDEKDGEGAGDEDEDEKDADGGNSADGESDENDEDESDEAKSKSDGDNPHGQDQQKDASNAAGANDDPSADTDDQTQEGLKNIAAKAGTSVVQHLLYPVLNDEVMKDRIVMARDFAEKAHKTLAANGVAASELEALEGIWNDQFLMTAKHMALEFERRKNAKCLANVKTAKSGKLDLTKLSQYRWTEDLFKRSMTVPNGKSHGIVMMIDGSGSMSSQFAAVIDQTLLFAVFAFQVNIPFEAYMFSDAAAQDANGNPIRFSFVSQGLNTFTLGESGRLIGLVNTTTDRAGFKRQIRALLAVKTAYDRKANVSQELSGAVHQIPDAALCGTPLFTGMMIAERIVARMKNQQKLDKTTFIVITDGEDTNRLWFKTNTPDPYAYARRAGYTSLDSPFVVRDAVTKKNLSFVQTDTYYGATMPQNGVLTMLLDVMKLRHDTRTVYIYMQEDRSQYYYSWQKPKRVTYRTDGFDYLIRAGKQEAAKRIEPTTITEALRADGQYVLPSDIAVADLAIILPVGSVTLTEDEFKKLDTADLTQKKIAAEFTKSMVKAQANRKFVNSVVPHLA
jgi:hypothetical protein